MPTRARPTPPASAGLPRHVIFCSAEAHYSCGKAAFSCGFGLDSVVKVAVDERGAMRLDALRGAVAAARDAGHVPMMVFATAGTTVRGGFDPIDAIADVCGDEDMFLHVDAAWGGVVAFSSAYRSLMAGAGRADSVAIDCHKMLGCTQQCAFLLVRDYAALSRCNSTGAAYLFQKDKENAAYDTGDAHVQCGRRNDSLKLWLMWLGEGDRGLGRRVTSCVDAARAVAARIEARRGDGLLLVAEPSCSNVCFLCVPAALRATEDGQRLMRDGPAALEADGMEPLRARLSAVPPVAKAQMQRGGGIMCGFQTGLLPHCNFWRLVFSSPVAAAMPPDAILDQFVAACDAAAA